MSLFLGTCLICRDHGGTSPGGIPNGNPWKPSGTPAPLRRFTWETPKCSALGELTKHQLFSKHINNNCFKILDPLSDSLPKVGLGLEEATGNLHAPGQFLGAQNLFKKTAQTPNILGCIVASGAWAATYPIRHTGP